MICFKAEPGRGEVDQELFDRMTKVLEIMEQRGTYPALPTDTPPIDLDTLQKLGMVNLCKVTRLSWERTVFGQKVKLADVVKIK